MAFYGTLLDANAFFAARLHSYDWDAAGASDRQKAMTQATELIDQFDYLNDKYPVAILDADATDEEKRTAELSQELQFPRGSVDTVPVEIERACYLIAQVLLSGRDPDMDLEALASKSTQYGDVKTTYNRNGNYPEHIAHLIPSPQAFNLLKPFFRERNQFRVNKL